jgi:hypothetical protein
MMQKIRRLKTFFMDWWCGLEQDYPADGKFLLLGGPKHLQIVKCWVTQEIVDTDEGIYRREFIGFENSVYHQVYVHEMTTKCEALDLLLKRKRHGEAS